RIAARTQYETTNGRSTTYSFGSRSEAQYCVLQRCRVVQGWSQGYVKDEAQTRRSNSTIIEQTGDVKYHLYGNDSAAVPGLRGRNSPTPDIDIHTRAYVHVWQYKNPLTGKYED